MRKKIGKIHYYGRNGEIILVNERNGAEGAPIVIQSSGYTIDTRTLVEPWIMTQVRTVPSKDRSELPDPFIFKMKSKAYKLEDCTVYTVYFLPHCEGIKAAAQDLYNLLESHKFNVNNILFVGHSKGSLLMTEMSKYIPENANMLLISPTYPTVFGDEQLVLKKLEESQDIRRYLIKPIVKIIGSRRRADYDMAPGSQFLKQLDLEQLSRHNVKLIISDCSCYPEGVFEKVFKTLGDILGLSRSNAGMSGHDGMCLVNDQFKLEPYCKETIEIKACHQNSFNRSYYWIREEIKELKNKNK